MKSKTNSAGNVLALLNRFKFPLITILAILIFSIYGKISDTHENRNSNVTIDTVEVTSAGDVQNSIFIDGLPETELETNNYLEKTAHKNAECTDKGNMQSGTIVISGAPTINPTMDENLSEIGFEVLGSATLLSGFDPLRCTQKKTYNTRGNVQKFSTKFASMFTDSKDER